MHADYVEKDRATYLGMQPCIEAGIVAIGSGSLEGRSFQLLNNSWDGRLDAAEEKLAAQAEEK